MHTFSNRLLCAMSVLALAACASAPPTHTTPPPHRVGGEIGSYPNAVSLGGTERLAGDQGGSTVNITPGQIGQYVLNTAGSQLPVLVTGDCLSNDGTVLQWSACGSGGGVTFPITSNQGGTGVASPTAHSIGVAEGVSNFTFLSGPGVSGVPLISGTSGSDPSFGAINLAGGSQIVTNILPIANGGIGSSTFAGANLPIYSGSFTLNDCVEVSSGSPVTFVDAGAACGSGGGGSPAGSSGFFQYNNAGSFGGYSPAQAVGELESSAANAQTGTSYTTVLADANIEVTMNNAAANSLAVPANASVAYAVGTLITVQQIGSGLTTVSPAAGVTIQSPAYGSSSSQAYSLGGIYGWVQLQKIATNTWNVINWVTPAQTQVGGSVALTGTCTTSASTLNATGGHITLSSAGGCTLILTPSGGPTPAHGFTGSMGDFTQPAVPSWVPSGTTTTAVTYTVPGAASSGDVLSVGPIGVY